VRLGFVPRVVVVLGLALGVDVYICELVIGRKCCGVLRVVVQCRVKPI
jgi:hypothetical protein